MSSLPTAEQIAERFLRNSVQCGAKPGDILGPRYWPDQVTMPGKVADFSAGLDYAVRQGWIEKLPGDQYRLTGAGHTRALC
jgi:hypothetical protein